MRGRASRILAVGLIVGLVPAATAHATDRYVDAVVGGNDTSNCTLPPPADGCEIEHGVEGVQTVAGDQIIIAPGTYAPAAFIVIADAGLKLIGPGPAQATINTSAAIAGVHVSAANVTVSGLRINYTGPGSGIFFSGAGGSLGERLSVTASSGGSACRFDVNGAVTLSDSVCSYTGNQLAAIQVSNGALPVVNLNNVTAQATETLTSGLFANASGTDVTVNVGNSILSSLAATDVGASSANPGADTVTVNLDYSDYADTTPNNADITITPAGTPNNITATPAFTDTDVTFHQAAGSPTIDKGLAAFATTPFDIDGGARIFGSAPDIGADEFVPVPPAVITPPTTTTPAPAPPATPKKKCKKKKKGAGAAKKGCKKKKR